MGRGKRAVWFSLLCWWSSAHAVDLDAAIGLTQFGKQPDGIWYQVPYSNEIDLTSGSIRFGVSDGAWRAGAEYLGSVRSTAFAKASDHAYLHGRPYPLSTWLGKGRAYGIYLTRDFSFLFVGAYAYKTTWRMVVLDWVGCDGPDDDNCRQMPPSHIQVNGRGDWGVTPIVGVRLGQFTLDARNIQTHGDPYPFGAKGLTWNLSVSLLGSP